MNDIQKLNINEWAEEDRPREKLMAKGANMLTDAELLAILIGSGSTKESAVDLMKRVLNSCDNNLNSGPQTLTDECRVGFDGIGKALV